LDVSDQIPECHRQFVALGTALVKQAGNGAPVYNLAGMFYVSTLQDEPWGLLSVPNALLRGVFDAMDEPGIELPFNKDGKLDAHLTVFSPQDIKLLGGPEVLVNDRGKTFHYTLGRLVALEPQGESASSKIFVLRCYAPELQVLRRSHGLSSLPHNGEWDFHLTVARVARGTLGRNAKTKDATSA
jgi:hypothetical protein